MVNHVTQLPSAFQGTLSLKQCMLGVGKEGAQARHKWMASAPG